MFRSIVGGIFKSKNDTWKRCVRDQKQRQATLDEEREVGKSKSGSDIFSILNSEMVQSK